MLLCYRPVIIYYLLLHRYKNLFSVFSRWADHLKRLFIYFMTYVTHTWKWVEYILNMMSLFCFSFKLLALKSDSEDIPAMIAPSAQYLLQR